jgi:sarcosine oxidase subunit gamma
MADLTHGLMGLRRSPLAHLRDRMALASLDDAVGLSETAYTGMVSVRVGAQSPAAVRVAAVIGAPLPAACGGVTSAGDHHALWLGPDEWLVVTGTDPVALADQLEAAVGDEPGLVLDVSANRTVLELTGPQARAVLEKGCPVDLHPRAFGAGRAVSTTLARVPLLLWQTGETSYRLLPRSSFADYVARWLLDAMLEYTA